MDDEAYVRLVREIEAEKGRVTAHEAACVERMRRIDDKMTTFQVDLDKVVKALGAGDTRATKWKDRVLYGAITVLFAFGAWSAGQLWHQEPMRVAQERGQ